MKYVGELLPFVHIQRHPHAKIDESTPVPPPQLRQQHENTAWKEKNGGNSIRFSVVRLGNFAAVVPELCLYRNFCSYAVDISVD